MVLESSSHGEHRHHLVSTPVGPVGLVLDGECLLRISLPLAGASLGGEPPPTAIRAALEAWFAGSDRALQELDHRLAGTPFQLAVWRATKGIARGGTRTYSEVAAMAGHPRGAARAVGAALRANPLPLLVPCHRVVGAGGALVGFGGSRTHGLELKRKLLALEGMECATSS